MSTINQLNVAMSSMGSSTHSDKKTEGSWFEAMADAWGQALDRQAATIENMSLEIGDGGIDTPAVVNKLTAESLKMTFLSNSSHTALSSVGSALDTMARKQ